ncbi:leucine-rich repeat domain-containing protein [Bernardetia sp. ABR2-2B]|uniref:leucine-rich repeat domain-containing protein n=1 Tax=Bernardetia sp. ABR2-2B TaxID=3127472 RepID=UPI0030CA7606
MSQLAKKKIRRNISKKYPILDLGNCGLDGTEDNLYEMLSNANHIKALIFSNKWYEYDEDEEKLVEKESKNKGKKNILKKLPKLPIEIEKLILSGGEDDWDIQDISNLSSLTKLTYLDLLNNKVSDISPLQKATKLNQLGLSGNRITDVSYLKNSKHLTHLYLSSNNSSNFHGLEHLEKLTFLGISSNNISNISSLENLTNLTTLYALNNQISDIQPLENLMNLTKLDIANNKISNIKSLEKLTNLTELGISDNKISDIDSIKKFINLTDLDISDNQVTDIIPIQKLVKLTHLDISNNKISDVTPIEKLVNLNQLKANKNQISDIHFIEKLTKLSKLSLFSNKILDIDSIANLKNLSALNISNNKGLDIKPIENLVNLNNLYISRNQITDINCLKTLINLTELDIRNNQITDVTPVENFTKLTDLDIGHNKILDISCVNKLTCLTKLDVQHNQIIDIEPLKNLINLTELNINDNQVTDIKSIEKLVNLTELCINGNQVTDIIPIEKLIKLTMLDISSNRISDITPIEKCLNLKRLSIGKIISSNYTALGNLEKLESLFMGGGIEMIETSFFSSLVNLVSLSIINGKIADYSFVGKLNKLRQLHLISCNITDTSFLETLAKLSSLNLSNNNIKDISDIKYILEKRELKHLYLHNNPIFGLPNELLGNWFLSDCLVDIKNYYNNKNFSTNDDIKVVVLGNGMVGKSTLLNRFFLRKGKWKKDIKIPLGERTEGIVIKRKENFVLSKNRNINLNIWDFGGQEIYHGTHRLFLDKDAVYIIVWTLETDEQKEEIRQELPYWLDYVQDLSADSPIILIHSQYDKKSEKDRKKINAQKQVCWNEKYQSNIVEEYLPLSAKEKKGKGFDKLDDAIRKAINIKEKLSNKIETLIPQKWVDIQKKLRKQRAKKEIPYKTYINFCKEYNIYKSEAKTLLKFLHSIGFLYYDRKLSENIILDQIWAIKAIYEILKPTSIANISKGQLPLDEIITFWERRGHNQQEIDIFVDFMVSSEVCFCKEQYDYKSLENPTFIFPHYLPEPDYLNTDWNKENNFYIIYKPQFFHKGIAERFLIRLGRLSSEKSLWKDGIRLKSKEFQGEALVTFHREKTSEREKGEVYICTENELLSNAIIKELNDILDDNSQTNPSEKVVFFYSLDGKEFVSKENILKSKKLKAEFVETTKGSPIELEKFLAKYRFEDHSNSKNMMKEIMEIDKEIENDNDIYTKVDLQEEAKKKTNPIPVLDSSKIGRKERKQQNLHKNIEATEHLINEWEKKKRSSENPNELQRAIEEVEKLDKILDDYEDQLEELEIS